MPAGALREGEPESCPDPCSAGLLDRAAVVAKKRQNATFKQAGAVAWMFGVGGFVPTSVAGLYHGVPWSVARWRPHDNVDAWLYVHCFSMWFWALAVAVQFCVGGMPQAGAKWVHRLTGYLAFAALGLGLLCGGLVYTSKYDFAQDQVSAGYYTVTISLIAWANMVMAVVRARQGRTGDHKDFVLMAFMWTMDPAAQRAAIHLLRFGVVAPYSFPVFIVGKLCGNVFLAVVFGYAAVQGQRENAVLVLNVAGQWALGVTYSVAILANLNGISLPKRDTHFLFAVTGICGAILMFVGLVFLWFKAGYLRCWRPTFAQRTSLIAWFLAFVGFLVTLAVPQGRPN